MRAISRLPRGVCGGGVAAPVEGGRQLGGGRGWRVTLYYHHVLYAAQESTASRLLEKPHPYLQQNSLLKASVAGDRKNKKKRSKGYQKARIMHSRK